MKAKLVKRLRTIARCWSSTMPSQGPRWRARAASSAGPASGVKYRGQPSAQAAIASALAPGAVAAPPEARKSALTPSQRHEQDLQRDERPIADHQDQRLHREIAEEEGDQPDQRVEGEDVAEPDEVEMEQAEDEQPEHARIMDPGRRRRPPPRARSITSRVLAPNRKEKRPRILPSTRMKLNTQEPSRRRSSSAIGERVDIGLERHREGDDVHRQYAHHRDAADDVERGDAAGLGRYGGGFDGRRRRGVRRRCRSSGSPPGCVARG